MSEPSQLIDLIKFANEGKPVDFNNAFQNIISQKALDTLDQERQEITQKIFSDDTIKDESSDVEQEQDIDAGVADENT